MVSCEECGKKLGIMEGYCHPTMGKKHHLCSPCYDQVSDSVAKWREFVLSNSFKANASNFNHMDWKKFAANFNQLNNVFENLMPDKEIILSK
jgi:hypothetical protein